MTISSRDSVTIRALVATDLPRLPQIRPTYRSDTVLRIDQPGQINPADPWTRYRWQLYEQVIDPPYDRGAGYNFFPSVQHEIGDRLARPATCSLLVAEAAGIGSSVDRLVGLLDMEYLHWNATVVIWRLMIDKDYRRIGLGKRLWIHAIAYANSQGARAIEVETQTTNVPACRFYENMGCTLSGLHTAHYDPATFAGTESEIALFWSYSLI